MELLIYASRRSYTIDCSNRSRVSIWSTPAARIKRVARAIWHFQIHVFQEIAEPFKNVGGVIHPCEYKEARALIIGAMPNVQ